MLKAVNATREMAASLFMTTAPDGGGGVPGPSMFVGRRSPLSAGPPHLPLLATSGTSIANSLVVCGEFALHRHAGPPPAAPRPHPSRRSRAGRLHDMQQTRRATFGVSPATRRWLGKLAWRHGNTASWRPADPWTKRDRVPGRKRSLFVRFPDDDVHRGHSVPVTDQPWPRRLARMHRTAGAARTKPRILIAQRRPHCPLSRSFQVPVLAGLEGWRGTRNSSPGGRRARRQSPPPPCAGAVPRRRWAPRRACRIPCRVPSGP